MSAPRLSALIVARSRGHIAWREFGTMVALVGIGMKLLGKDPLAAPDIEQTSTGMVEIKQRINRTVSLMQEDARRAVKLRHVDVLLISNVRDNSGVGESVGRDEVAQADVVGEHHEADAFERRRGRHRDHRRRPGGRVVAPRPQL